MDAGGRGGVYNPKTVEEVYLGRRGGLIKALTTVFEVVVGSCKKLDKSSSISTHSSTKSKSNTKLLKYEMLQVKDNDDDDEDEDEDEHGDTLCGACNENNVSDEFWICCDICESWFNGKCVKVTPAKAELIKHYKCPSCSTNKRLLNE